MPANKIFKKGGKNFGETYLRHITEVRGQQWVIIIDSMKSQLVVMETNDLNGMLFGRYETMLIY